MEFKAFTFRTWYHKWRQSSECELNLILCDFYRAYLYIEHKFQRIYDF